MKRFLIRILSFIGIPVLVLLAVYLMTDPFKTLHPFSFDYCDNNRDYISSELFLRNNPKYHYNSFVFGSSRCCGFNTYHWKHYLPEGATQFLFQAWGETLTGIEQKIDYIDRNGNDIDNVIVLFDIPNVFSNNQLPNGVLLIKHYKFSGQSKVAFQFCLFYGFIQKPSKWFSSIKQYINPVTNTFTSDTISNDWNNSNKDLDIIYQPKKDSLLFCSLKARQAFLKEIEEKTESDLKSSRPQITPSLLKQLKHIKSVFEKHHTNYKIIISPAYCYNHPAINKEDLKIIQNVFGKDKVFDYSGKNDITTDYNNFSDPNHFGLSVGWQIIEEIYNK